MLTYRRLFKPRRWKLVWLKYRPMFYAKKFVRKLSGSISSNFGAIQSKIAKKNLKTPNLGFKVIQGHWC